MLKTLNLTVREIRAELGLSQSELAGMVGIGLRAIQSYEQEWRRPSEMVERMLLLLLIGHRNGSDLSNRLCWEQRHCPDCARSGCVAYVTRQGHLCWLLTGTMCEGPRRKSWDDKIGTCRDCSFFHRLLKPERKGAAVAPGRPEVSDADNRRNKE